MIPGRTLHRLAARACSADALERVVEPAIADLQKEYASAVFGSTPRLAWVLLRGYLAILEVMLMCALQPTPVPDDDRRALIRTFVWAAGIIASAGGLLIVLTIAIVMIGGAPWPRLIHLALLIPMAFPIALPIGLTLGLAFGFGGRAAAARTKRTIIVTAFALSLVSLGTLWMITPLANQAFRQATFNARGGQGIVMKGTAEMTLPELRQQASAAASGRQTELARMGQWNYQMRVALSFGTLVLAWFSLTVAGRLSHAPRAMVMAGCAAYFALIFAGEALVSRGAPPAAAAWLANGIFLAATVYLSISRRQKPQASLSVA